MRTVSVKQQLQRPTTERELLADLHAELWYLLSSLGNWQADQFTCIIRTPTLREAIMVKIVRIIIEFLWCVLSEAVMDILYLVTRLKVLLGFVSFHI